MILLDTSILVEALTGRRRAADTLGRAIERGERLAFPTLVLYEWPRGPRTEQEIADQEALFPSADALAFGATEAPRPPSADTTARLSGCCFRTSRGACQRPMAQRK